MKTLTRLAIVVSIFFSFSLIHNKVQAATLPAGFGMQTYVSGLTSATKIVNVPDGRMFVTEKGGKVRVIQNGQLLAQPLLDISDHVNNFEDRGLLSMAVDPNFATNGTIYLFYTYLKPGTNFYQPQTGRLTKVVLPSPTSNTANPAVNPTETILLGSIDQSYVDGVNTPCQIGTDCIPQDSTSHSVGDIAFANDGTMFLTLGDGAEFVTPDVKALRAQNIDWLSGKVLHINTNGQGLASNPFYNGDVNSVRSKVYQIGLRNPFRLYMDPQQRLYISDVGWYSYEEINTGAAGANFGWPCYEGAGHMNDYANDPSTSAFCATLYASNTVQAPFYSFPHVPIGGGAAAIGGTKINNSTFPADFQGNYIFGDYNNQTLSRIIFNADGSYNSTQQFGTGFPGFVQVFSFPNGDLGWISIWTGTIYKITYNPVNVAPTAIAKSNVTSGALPLTINFKGSDSTDPDSTTLQYSWNFGDGQTSNIADPSHTYITPGDYTVTLTVSDGIASNQAQLNIFAGNKAPVVNIISPLTDTIYSTPYSMHYSGSATDPEDGNLTGNSLTWKIIAHHNDHVHVPLDNIHGSEGDFTLDYHGLNTYFEVQLTATDSQGLSTTKSVIFKVSQIINVCTDNNASPLAMYNFENSAADLGPLGIYESQLSNTSFTNGSYGKGIQFNNDSKIITPNFNLNQFTLNFWINPDDNSSIRHIVGNKATGSSTNGFSVFMNAWNSTSRELIIEIGDGTNGKYIATPYNTIVSGVWQMITITYDGNTVTIYKNGIQVAQQVAGINFKTTGSLIFGQFMDGQWQYQGKLDSLAIWNRAISNSEVSTIATDGPVLNCQPTTPVSRGQVMFKVKELDEQGNETGNDLDGATIKLLNISNDFVMQTSTSQYGWAQINNAPIGTYNFVVYKAGYKAVWIQTDCGGNKGSAQLNSDLTENLSAAIQSNVNINANQTTWCKDVGLQKLLGGPIEYGSTMFRVKEFDVNGVETGNFVDGATIKILNAAGDTVIATGTSANGWAQISNIPTGIYTMIVYKQGYIGGRVQLTCGNSWGNLILQNNLTDNFVASWSKNLRIQANQTTWCHDVGLQVAP